MKPNFKYTCNEYRQEMILLGLKQRLNNDQITEEEKGQLIREIEKLESEMCMD